MLRTRKEQNGNKKNENKVWRYGKERNEMEKYVMDRK